MFSTKVNTKSHKGFTLLEIIITLSLITIVMSILAGAFKVHYNAYEFVSEYSTNNISIKEALMFIEREINRNSIGVRIDNNTLLLGKNTSNNGINWSKANKIMKSGDTLRYYYEEVTPGSYISQPLLYDVETFALEENNRVIFIKIKTKDGTVCEKAFSKKNEDQ